jgi:type I restriction enzyme S subunit
MGDIENNLPTGWSVDVLANLIQPRGEKVLPSEFLEYQFIGMDNVESQTTKIIGTVPALTLKSKASRFYQGDVLYGRLRPYLNKVTQVNFEGLASAEFLVFPSTHIISNSYLKYRFNAIDFVNFASHLNEGDRPRISFEQIGNFKINLPPLAEQHRIVAKVEELFSELDKGIESLKKAQEQLKIYRQAVLKYAFEGKLTEKWREQQLREGKLESAESLLEKIKLEREKLYQEQLKEWEQSIRQWEANGKQGKKPVKPKEVKEIPQITRAELSKLPRLPDKWLWVKIAQIYLVFVGSTPSRKEEKYWNGEINWVSSGEVSFCNIYTTKEKITQLGLENSSTEIHPVGTVMLGMIGEGKTRGQSAILMIPAAHNQNTAAIRVGENSYSSKLLYHYFYFQYEETRTIGSGNNQKALNKTRVENINYPFCSLQEQDQIVQEIESRLSICDQVEATIIENLQRAESLRQSILKQAFEGKLVPQDPNDEPAEKLLERIKQEKSKINQSLQQELNLEEI